MERSLTMGGSRAVVPLGSLALVVAACAPPAPPVASPSPTGAPSTSSTTTPSTTTPSPSSTASEGPSPSDPSPSASGSSEPGERADPRWRFFARESRPVTSPWYAGAYRTMIDFGCTDAPYYKPDSRCKSGEGFHHGVDVAMPCGTPLTAGVEGCVVVGDLGSAYGSKAFRIRTDSRDVVLGHVQQVRVRDGQRVRPGDTIAEVGDLGAPDGCHLHLEIRARNGGVASAMDPSGVARLTVA